MRLAPRSLDRLIVGALLAALLAETLTSDVVDDPRWAIVLLGAVIPALVLLARRTHPLAALAVIGACDILCGLIGTPINELGATMLPVIVVSYALGRHGSRAQFALGLVVLAGCLVGVNLTSDDAVVGDFVFPALIFGTLAVTGRALRGRALVTSELADRTERLTHEQEARELEAVADERRRVARELHDVVAHTLSVMVVQAGAARRTVDRDPARASEALEVVETTGRDALGELRRLLGFVGDGTAPVDPAPTLADLDGLVRRSRDAGLRVGLEREGVPAPLAAGAEAAAYRIVQEALTNALKHGGVGTSATVAVRWTPDALELEVRDRGGGGAAGLPSGGHGLVGMAERASLYGGVVDARQDGDGFVVLARLPIGAGVPA